LDPSFTFGDSVCTFVSFGVYLTGLYVLLERTCLSKIVFSS